MFFQEKTPNKGNETIKNAFERVKTDIFVLGNETSELKKELLDLKSSLVSLNNSLNTLRIQQISIENEIKTLNQILKSSSKPYKQAIYNPTHNPPNPTHFGSPTDNPTHPMEIRGLKYPNLPTSIGNRGVPTDKPTDRQTNQQTDNYPPISPQLPKSITQNLSEASQILESLDSIKKQIRLKFKSITAQEMLVFSTIYQLEELDPTDVDYKKIAQKLNLSESSIRDYVKKIINKGIPLLKTKFNNKKVLLSVSSELKKVASLQTIINLREI